MGRPVGIVFGGDGAMYLSDDASGVIYRITYAK
jgi:glucose/arabinose dehydrogenase